MVRVFVYDYGKELLSNSFIDNLKLLERYLRYWLLALEFVRLMKYINKFCYHSYFNYLWRKKLLFSNLMENLLLMRIQTFDEIRKFLWLRKTSKCIKRSFKRNLKKSTRNIKIQPDNIFNNKQSSIIELTYLETNSLSDFSVNRFCFFSDETHYRKYNIVITCK